MRVRRAAAAVAVLALVGGIAAAPASGKVNGKDAKPLPVSNLTGPLDTGDDLDAALHFEELIPEHDFYGMIVPLGYREKAGPLPYVGWPNIDPDPEPIRFEGEADSGNYTGEYLAAQSWRYAQATTEIAALADADGNVAKQDANAHRFWQRQRDEALARADEIVRYYHMLVNISREWQTQTDPQIRPERGPQLIDTDGDGIPDEMREDQDGWIDYGGGVIPGEEGLLMRTCTPAEHPETPEWADLRHNYGGSDNLLGPFPWEDGRDWYCLGSTSRDSYMGTVFGLGVALDYLGAENAELRELLAHDLMAMTDYAIKYLWLQVRPHGMISDPVTGGNDLHGPVSPMFAQVPLQRLTLLKTAQRAAELTGNAEKKQTYDALYAEEVATSVLPGQLMDSMLIDAAGPHSAYYKYQLNLVAFFNLVRLETDPTIRQELLRGMGVLDATLTDDGNPFFETIAYALTGETERVDEAVRLHREFLDYYRFHDDWVVSWWERNADPETGLLDLASNHYRAYTNSDRCSFEPAAEDAPWYERPLACRYNDEVDIVQPLPNGDEVVTPFQPYVEGVSSTKPRAAKPLPVPERRLADFLWQKDPTVATADHHTPWRGPSIDFLVTYWMLRYYTEVEVPALTPLPAWAGPRFE